MANKYTALQLPPKKDLEALYHGKFMSQSEVGLIYKTTQKVVYSWFKKLGIKSRVAYKRNQYGENNSSWKGSSATYAALHYRVQNNKGKADHCVECGRNDKGINYDWANQSGNYSDINDYKMMCRSCHFKMDGHKRNFPNNNLKPNLNKRKLIDGKL
jgi:hypothetical protein